MIVRCRRCGRKLTIPKSIERGFGPVCYKKTIDELWKPTERDMPPEQNGQTIYTRNQGETLKALKTVGRPVIIIQDEEWKISNRRKD